MSTDKTIKKAVEKCISLLPENLQNMELAFQISEIECARNQIDGISCLLVVEGRWSRPIGDWVKAQLDELDARIQRLVEAKHEALLKEINREAA